MKGIELIKRNWKQSPRLLKSGIVRKLHKNLSIRQIGKMLDVPKSSVFYHIQKRKDFTPNPLSVKDFGNVDFNILGSFCDQLLGRPNSTASSLGDEAVITLCGRDKHG